MDTILFEDFSTAKYTLPRNGSYTVSTNIEQEGILVVVAHGTNLETANFSSYKKSDPGILNLLIEDILDDEGNAQTQFVWMFTLVKPELESDGTLVFGRGIGEDNKDIAKVEFVLSDNNPEDIANISTIPNQAFIPSDYQSQLRGILPNPPGSRTASISVVHDVNRDNPIQDHAQVLLINHSTHAVHKFWDGKAGHNTPLNIGLRGNLELSLCAIIKSNPEKDVEKDHIFKFEVGDPRVEATVTVEEEA